MKSISSLPLLAKVGGGSVAAAGAITGGIFLHKHFEFPKGLDKELINETSATLSFSNGSGQDSFTTVTGKNSEVTATIKASSSVSGSKFTNDKWTCTIKGIAKEEGSSSPDLSQDSSFSKTDQKSKFTDKFTSLKEGFVKSCARNRTPTPTESENWTSEIVVLLKKPTTGDSSSQKYEFSSEDVEKIFEGTWINPEVN